MAATRDGPVVQLGIQLGDPVPHVDVPGAELRRMPRLPLGLSAHCQIDGIVAQHALGDLSTGGLYLRTSTPLRLGARARIVLGLPYIGGQRVCTLSATVLRLDREGGEDGPVRGAGLGFDETDGPDHELLVGFLLLWGSSPVPG